MIIAAGVGDAIMMLLVVTGSGLVTRWTPLFSDNGQIEIASIDSLTPDRFGHFFTCVVLDGMSPRDLGRVMGLLDFVRRSYTQQINNILLVIENSFSAQKLIRACEVNRREVPQFFIQERSRLEEFISLLSKRPAVSVALSSRQQEVLKLIGQGLTKKEVATRLGLQEETIKSHLRYIALSLGISRDRARMIEVAYRLGLMD